MSLTQWSKSKKILIMIYNDDQNWSPVLTITKGNYDQLYLHAVVKNNQHKPMVLLCNMKQICLHSKHCLKRQLLKMYLHSMLQTKASNLACLRFLVQTETENCQLVSVLPDAWQQQKLQLWIPDKVNHHKDPKTLKKTARRQTRTELIIGFVRRHAGLLPFKLQFTFHSIPFVD